MIFNKRMARFSHTEIPEKQGSNLGESALQQDVPETASFSPSLKRTSSPGHCCVCGFPSNHGVYVGQSCYEGYSKVFACEKCFKNPNIFLVGKRILPHWTLAIKTQSRVNTFARDYAKGIGSNIESVVLTKRGKMQVIMSEDLYRGQKQLLETSP